MITEEMKETWRRKISTCIKAKELKLIALSDWEWDFILNIEYRMNHIGSITIQQSITLNNIYAKVK